MSCTKNYIVGGIEMNDNFKKYLPLITIPVVGFILLNLTFIFAAVIHIIYSRLLGRLFSMYSNMGVRWIPVSRHFVFAIIIIVISWFIFKSKKIKDLYKAIFAVVPTAVILVTEGIFFYQWPVATYALGALIYGIIIFYLYKKKKPWFYYYSVSWVSLVLLLMGIFGIDI